MEYVRDIKAFYIHLLVFAVVITGLTIINLFFTRGYFWVLWAAFGWGIGLLSHGLSIFETFNLFGDGWEKRQIKKRMRRQK
nr:2TM domain-containing protein [Sulfitobacter maritimus]